MKSKYTVLFITLIAFLPFHSLSFGQDRGNGRARPSPNAAVTQNIGTTIVSVTYGRPGLKGRALESLTPAGKVWRTGANESAAITFSGDVLVGGKAVSAGTYSLYTVPGDDEWTIIINSKLSWGTQYDKAMDVVRTRAGVSSGSQTEWFEIDFDTLSDSKAHLNLRWGTKVVSVPIEVKS